MERLLARIAALIGPAAPAAPDTPPGSETRR
jgi:hypothetical protein